MGASYELITEFIKEVVTPVEPLGFLPSYCAVPARCRSKARRMQRAASPGFAEDGKAARGMNIKNVR